MSAGCEKESVCMEWVGAGSGTEDVHGDCIQGLGALPLLAQDLGYI
jgi:hypothetical protein